MPKRELPQVAIFQCYFSQTGNFSVKTFPLPFCNILLVVMIIHFYLFRNQTAVQLCNQSNTPKAHSSFVWKILIVKKYKINPLRITNMLSALCNKQNSNEAGRIFSKYIIKAVGKYETVVWHKCNATLFVKVFWEQLSDTLAKWIFLDRNMALDLLICTKSMTRGIFLPLLLQFRAACSLLNLRCDQPRGIAAPSIFNIPVTRVSDVMVGRLNLI